MTIENRIAYLGISKSNRVNFDKEIESIKQCLEKYKIDLEVFVDKYEFTLEQEKEMMKTAFEEISNCEFIIVELTKKAIGVGVEVGYAKAKNKPIIYIKRNGAKHSTTVGGASDFVINYKDDKHLQNELNDIMKFIYQK